MTTVVDHGGCQRTELVKIQTIEMLHTVNITTARSVCSIVATNILNHHQHQARDTQYDLKVTAAVQCEAEENIVPDKHVRERLIKGIECWDIAWRVLVSDN